MKYRLLILLLAVSIAYTNSSNAQLVGDNTFLSGKWLQVAIAPNGSWGNTLTPPAGYYTHGSASTYPDPVTGTSPASGMDFSYDYGHDGFTVGTDGFYGAYFLPGTPFDGWSVQVNGARSDAYYTDAFSGFYYNSTTDSLKGTTDSFVAQNGGCLANPNRQIGVWHGGFGPGGKLRVTQVNILDTLASWLKVNTKFVNTSTDTMHGVYYFVSADPDNDVSVGGSYTTDNHICYQGDGLNRHEVNAVPDPGAHPRAFSGLATKDCRAKALIYQSWPPSTVAGNNLDLVWNETATGMGGTYYDLYHTTVEQDIAYGMIYKLGDLAPGDSTTLSFAWIFSDSTAIDSAFPELSPKIVTEGGGHSIYDSVYGCTMNGCGISGTSFTVNIPGAEEDDWAGSTWTWAPTTGITSSLARGSQVTIDMMGLSGPTVFTVTGTKDIAHGQCASTSGSKIFYLYAQPCFHATSDIPCLGDTIHLDGHGDSTGATYIWSGPGTGGSFSSTQQYAHIYPSTWADTGTYRLIKTIGSDHDTVYTHVTIRPLPLVTAGSNAPICSQTTLLLTATAYTGGETYTWSGPNGFASGLQDPSRTGAPVKDEGLYKVVTLLNGCKDSGYINVVIDTTPALPVLGSNGPICSHRDTLYLTATDVTPGVSYAWVGPNGFASLLQNPKIVADVSVLYSGLYTVTATFATCSNTNTLNVLVDKTPDRPVPVTNAPVCSGNTLTMGATSDAGSTYNWVGPNGFASGFQDPLITPVTMAATGIYSVTATIFYPGIAGGCVSDTITLNVIIDSMVTAGFTYQIHYGCVADTIAFTNNSTIATRFLWEFGDGTSSGDVNPAHVYTVQNYDTVVLSSSAGVCVATQRQIINDVHPLNAAFTSDSTIICQGRTINFTDGSVSTGGSYLWNFGDGATSLTASPSHTFTKAGVYNVFEVVTDFIPCRDTARETVYIDSLSPVYISLSDAALCQATYVTVTGDYSSIGNTGIVWNFGDGDSVKNTNPVSYAYSTPGTYTISATALYRVCADATATKTITIEPQPTINLGADQSICKGSDIITLADGTNSSTSGATWLWSTGQTTSSIVITDPGTYTATVTIDGCSASSSVNVTNDCYMNIPNVFTPNGDGLNDYFFPRQALTSGLTSFSIVIYNRWGTKVFESNSLTGAGWDGKLGGVDQPEDVYIYIIDGTFKDGQKEHHQGNVTLLR